MSAPQRSSAGARERRTAGPASPMRGGYLVRNPLLYGALRSMDAALNLLVSRPAEPAGAVERVLIGVGGHLGDAVMATAAVAAVHRMLPHARLGVISGSWSAGVLAGLPAVDWQHTVDHWAVARSSASRVWKMGRYARSARHVVRSLRSVGYDMAIDLYPFYPNMGALFWLARIPRRVGFASGGGRALYSRSYEWVDDRQHIVAKQLELVRNALGGPASGRELAPDAISYRLPEISTRTAASAAAKLSANGVGDDYVVVHAGVGDRTREWPVEKWRMLAESLSARGTIVVLTGSGLHDDRLAVRIAAGVGGCVNLSSRLDWGEFVYVLSDARAVVCANTAAGHVASAAGTPALVLMAGTVDPREFRPLGDRAVTLSKPVPCAPCFRSRGCATMDCVRGLEPDLVLRHLDRLLAAPA